MSMSGPSGEQGGVMAEINVTPLVDVKIGRASCRERVFRAV